MLIKKINELREYIQPYKADKDTIGLVPTMGALHDGHLSLIKAAKEKCENFLNLKEPLSNDDSLHIARRMPFFDEFRDINYPDIVQAQLLDLEKARIVSLRIVEASTPGIVLAKAIEDDEENNIKKDDLFNIFPSFFDGEKIILALRKEEVVISNADGELVQAEDELERLLISKIEETLEEIKVRIANKEKYKC